MKSYAVTCSALIISCFQSLAVSNAEPTYVQTQIEHELEARNDHLTQQHQQLNTQIQELISKLKIQSPQARIQQRVDRLGPSLMLKLNRALPESSIESQAIGFIEQYKGLWGKVQFAKITEVTQRKNHHVITLKGEIEGREIFNQGSKMMIQEGKLTHMNNGIGALHHVVQAKISIEEAKKRATAVISQAGLKIESLVRGAVSYEPGVAYEVFQLRVIQSQQLKSWIVLLDGRDGAIISLKSGEIN